MAGVNSHISGNGGRGGNLANTYFSCVVLSPSLCMLIQLSSSISVNSDS